MQIKFYGGENRFSWMIMKFRKMSDDLERRNRVDSALSSPSEMVHNLELNVSLLDFSHYARLLSSHRRNSI
jgi:hypothetical protein